MKALLLSLLVLSGCAAVDLLKPADPCKQQFTTPITINQCRIELGIQAEADRITALANAAERGDTATQAALQKRLNRLKQLRKNQALAEALLSNDPSSAEAQLSILVAALEKITDEQ